MRIALVGPVHPWRGGIAQYLGLLGEALMPHAEVRGVTFTRQYPGFLFPGGSQLDPEAEPPRFPVAALLDSIDPWSWRRTAVHLEAFAPGLVLLKWWIPFFAPAFASAVGPLRRRGTRVALVCDNLIPHERRPFDPAFTRWMLRNSDGYLVMSQSVERDLDSLKPGAPRRRVLHPLYAQFDRGRWTRETARARLGLDGEVAVFFGYVRRYKGLDTLLDAWPAVRARRPVTLVVAGEFYEDGAPYRAQVARANAGAAPDALPVRLVDRYLPDDEVEALLKAADVVVLPYRSATQSGVTHVAYALGKPVITTDVGGLAETVRPGETGLVVPPEDPAALAEAIVRFFADGLGPRLSQGVEALRHAHSWESLAARVMDLGDTLAPEKGVAMSRVIAFVPPARVMAARAWMSRQTARWIGITLLLVYALTASGHIQGSDEVTMLELSRAMLRGGIAVPEGATLDGRDGRHYTKNTAGQAVLALPLVALAEVATARLPIAAPRRMLAMRAVVSIFNAIVTALVLALFYRAVRALGVKPTAAFDAALMLGLTTPLWPYAKTFAAEPLQALGLLLALDGSARAAQGESRAAWSAGWGLLIAVTVKLSMLPLALLCLFPLTRARWTAWLPAALMLLLGLAANAAYDLARFGTVLETGYGAQATWASHTTPLWTGLYGLLVSSGKGVLWFAPALWLAIPGWVAMRRSGAVQARVVIAIAAAWAATLALYGTFEHWAGDGSFGPRYVVPLIPLAFVPVAWFIGQGRRWRRGLALLLALAGLVVQLGGVAVYFGAEMREAGDYPYTRALNDPQFMHESHFVPGHSPIVGHWRMLIRNAGEHFARKLPKLVGGDDVDPRLGIGAEDQVAMLHALDFWWLYAAYAGIPPPAIVGALLVLLAFAGWSALRMLMVADEEAQAA